jgi:hypothetical protein
MQRLAGRTGRLDERADVLQAQASLDGDFAAGGGDCNTAIGPVDELHLEQRLEILNCGAEGRL